MSFGKALAIGAALFGGVLIVVAILAVLVIMNRPIP